MKVATRREGAAVAILDLEGQLIINADTKEFQGAIDDLLELGIGRVVLNLEGVSSLDCAGISQLLECRQRISTRQGVLRMVGLSLRMEALLDIFRLRPVLGVYESERAAVASFFSPPSAVSSRGERIQPDFCSRFRQRTTLSVFAPTGT